jgi:hypothetical protein
MLFLFKKYQEVILILLEKLFQVQRHLNVRVGRVGQLP